VNQHDPEAVDVALLNAACIGLFAERGLPLLPWQQRVIDAAVLERSRGPAAESGGDVH
jgi:hypothetical protein